MAQKRGRPDPSAAGPESHAKRSNYLQAPSDYVANIDFHYESPVPVPTVKFLRYPLAYEVYCGYRPTTAETRSFLQLMGAGECGPVVDLINPVAAYPTSTTASLAPEDAALLVGLIPGVEKYLVSSAHEQPVPVSPDAAEVVRDKDADPFQHGREFTHPLKSNLTPIQVLNVLPHPELWANKFVHGSVPQLDRLPPDKAVLLKNSQDVSSRLRNFALYEPSPKEEADGKAVADREGQQDPFLEGMYRLSREYIVRLPEPGTLSVNLLLDLPPVFFQSTAAVQASLSTASGSLQPNDPAAEGGRPSEQPVYFTPLRGPKLLFTKASGRECRAKPLLWVGCRPPTEEEQQEEQTAWAALRRTEVKTEKPLPEGDQSSSSSSSPVLSPKKPIASPPASRKPAADARRRRLQRRQQTSSSDSSSSGSSDSSSASSSSGSSGEYSDDDSSQS